MSIRTNQVNPCWLKSTSWLSFQADLGASSIQSHRLASSARFFASLYEAQHFQGHSFRLKSNHEVIIPRNWQILISWVYIIRDDTVTLDDQNEKRKRREIWSVLFQRLWSLLFFRTFVQSERENSQIRSAISQILGFVSSLWRWTSHRIFWIEALFAFTHWPDFNDVKSTMWAYLFSELPFISPKLIISLIEMIFFLPFTIVMVSFVNKFGYAQLLVRIGWALLGDSDDREAHEEDDRFKMAFPLKLHPSI